MARNYQLNATLAFTADTAKAKAEIQNLQQSLIGLNSVLSSKNQSNIFKDMSIDAKKTMNDLAKIQSVVSSSISETTGKMDISKFASEMKASGMSVKDFRNTLTNLGPAGEKTFLNLSKSVLTAEQPLKKTNKLVSELAVSFQNTAKWLVSSSVLKGLISSFQGAFRYAQDLNESLNRIQIVTQASTEHMADFAKQANIAAKNLSTTTVDYTNAALIYYQQGLSDAEVQSRTDITIKAANAAGATAQEMSDYLTAVWNSYKVGEDELERYVDIMAALGAGTATSLEEISTAMEKVASVGQATGVSFEQLASIVATVSSVTRTSAESVGTAYKTIFARMADLKLEGSIDEDGVTTTLGTVSTQLEQVGIHILDDKGELRDMGVVIEELMDKWMGMNEATQQAVAIAIAGKRQYTQLLALMNNQDMYKNAMGMAEGSQGTLEKQQEIFAQSWEASQKRVKAAAEGIYDSLINDKFFINFNNIIAEILKSIEHLIDSMGGFTPMLLNIGSVFLMVFNKQISAGINNAIASVKNWVGITKQETTALRQEFADSARNFLANNTKTGSYQNTTENQTLDRKIKLYSELIDKGDQLNEQEKKTLSFLLDQLEVLDQQLVKESEIVDQKLKQTEKYTSKNSEGNVFVNKGTNKAAENYQNAIKYEASTSQFANRIKSLSNTIDFTSTNGQSTKRIQQINNALQAYQKELKDTGLSLEEVFGSKAAQKIKKVFEAFEKGDTKEIQKAIEQVDKALQIVREDAIKAEEALDEAFNAPREKNNFNLEGETEEERQQSFETQINGIKADLEDAGMSEGALLENMGGQAVGYESANDFLDEAVNKLPTVTEAWTNMASGITSAAMSLQGLVSLWNIWQNEDTSFLDKMLASFMQIGFILPNVINAIKMFANQETILALYNTITGSSFTVLSAETVSFGTALWTVLWPIGLVLAALAALAAIIYVVVKAYNKHHEAAERANKAAEELAESAQDARQEAENLASTFDKYKAAKEKLSECKRGTDEWRDALKEANSAALELIDTASGLMSADDLRKLYQRNNEGLIEINEQQTEDLIQKAEDKAAAAEAAAASGKQLAQIARAKADLVDSGRANLTYYEPSSDGRSSYRSLDSERAADIVIEHYNELQNLTLEEFKDKMKEFGLSMDKISDTSLQKFQESVNNNIEAVDKSSEALKAYANMLADDILGDKYGGAEKTIASDKTTQLEKELHDKYVQWMQDGMTQWDGSENGIYKEMLKKLQALGYDYNAATNGVRGNDDNRTLAFTDSKGTEVTHSMEWVASTIAAGEALQKLEVSAENAAKVLNKLDESEFSSGIRDFLTNGNFNASLSYKDISSLQGLDTTEMSDKLKEIFQTDDLEEVAHTLGKESAEKLIQGIQEGLSNSQKDFDDAFSYVKDMTKTALQDQYASMETVSQEELDKIKAQLEDLTSEEMQNVAETLKSHQGLVDYLRENSNAIAIDVSTYKDLADFMNGEFSGSLDSIIDKFYLTEESAEKVGAALKEVFKEAVANEIQEAAKEFDMEADELQNLADAFIEMGEAGKEGYEAFTHDKEAVVDATVAHKRLNDGVLDLSENYKDYISTLKEARSAQDALDKANIKNTESYKNLRKSLSDILNTSEDLIDIDLMKNIDPADLEAAANGSEAAIEKIRDAFIKLQAESQNIDFNKAKRQIEELYATVNEGGYLTLNNSDFIMTLLASAIQAGASAQEIENLLSGLGISADISEFTGSLDEAVAEAKAAGAQVATALSYTTEVEPTQVEGISSEQGMQVTETLSPEPGSQITTETLETLEDGSTEIKKLTYTPVGYKKSVSGEIVDLGEKTETKTAFGQTVTNGDGDSGSSEKKGGVIIKNARKTTTGGVSPTTKNTAAKNMGGGGKSPKGSGGKSKSPSKNSDKPKSPQKTKAQETELKRHEDEVTRYKNTDNLLESQSRKLEKLSKLKEHSVGKKYLDAIDAENAALLKENELLEQQIQEAKDYMNMDLKKLQDYGLTVALDDAGIITNVEQLETALVDKENEIISWYDNVVNAENTSWDAISNTAGENGVSDVQKEAHETTMEDLEKEKEERERALEDAKKALSNYEEANKKAYTDQTKLEENLYNIRSNNLDKINHKTEKQLKLIENENKVLDLQKRLIQDNDKFWKAPEVLEKTIGKTESLLANGLAYSEKANALLTADLNNEEAFEALGDALDGLVNSASEALDYIEEMKEAFPETVNKIADSLGKLYDKFGNMASTLDSYKSLAELIGMDKNYRYMNKLLETQKTVTKNQYDASRNTYQMWSDQYDKLSNELDHLQKGTTEYDIKAKEVQSVYEQMAESQQNMLSNAQEWVETLGEIRDLKLQELFKDLEDTLTNGEGFDILKSKIDLLKTDDDYYLTTTNQQYETQKLIRQAQKDLDNASNQMAKNRLQIYIKETEEIQKQGKLSKLELQVQQERYNLALAEIALQEAQSNKSQVTLQRDSEGNFNYVYTADEDKIAEAQQKVEDSQNIIYNLLRDGVNSFAEAMLELDEEYYNELQNIDMQTEEGKRKAEELREIYLKKRNMVEEQYNYAAEELGDQLVEAYGDDIRENILSTQEFNHATDECVDDMKAIWRDFQRETREVKGLINEDLGSMRSESYELKREIIKMDEDSETALNKMNNAMNAWADIQLQRLNEQIRQWQTLSEVIQNVMRIQSGFDSSTNYMQVFEDSTSIGAALQALNNRDTKVAMQEYKHWGSNYEVLQKDIRDQSAQIERAGNAAGALDAAARREAKLQWYQNEAAQHGDSTNIYSLVEDTVGFLDRYFAQDSGLTQDEKDALSEYLKNMRKNGQRLSDTDLINLRKLAGYNIASAASGGYTGDFEDSSMGKIGILHEKELILNPDDTKNFLEALDLTDQILESLKFAGLQYMTNITSKELSKGIQKTTEKIEQEVHINAEFPSVQDHNEIEIAIENLINTSAQYANRGV